MNVKIADNSITFKITELELSQILAGDDIEKELTIAPQAFTTTITTNTANDELAIKMESRNNKVFLALYTPHKCAQKLATIGKNNEGISYNYNGLKLRLQVDVRTDSRRRI